MLEVGKDKDALFPVSSQLKEVLQKFCCKDQALFFANVSMMLPPSKGSRQGSPIARGSGLQCEAARTQNCCWAPWAFTLDHSKWGYYLVHASLHLCSCLLGLSQTELLTVFKFQS